MVDEPMFPGYVFLKGTLDDAYEADRTRRVARIIPVVDQTQLATELKSLWLALEDQAILDPFPYLRCGMRVEVRSGPEESGFDRNAPRRQPPDSSGADAWAGRRLGS